jgi:hypothetical protein
MNRLAADPRGTLALVLAALATPLARLARIDFTTSSKPPAYVLNSFLSSNLSSPPYGDG